MAAQDNKIIVGALDAPSFVFDNTSIQSVSSMQSVALVGQTLSVDQFSPVVADDWGAIQDIDVFALADGSELLLADGKIFTLGIGEYLLPSKIISIPYATPVWYYHEGALVGKFYLRGVERLGKNAYRLNCFSAIGLLQRMPHAGGFWAAASFGDVLADILDDGSGNPVFDYSVDFDVATVQVSGWLPHGSKRDSLYQLIFANGVNIIPSPDGSPRFTFIHTAPEDAVTIERERVYEGGSVDYQSTYSRVEVLEHTYAYIPDTAAQTLYDNTERDPAALELIWFQNAPIYVPSVTASDGLLVQELTENGCVVSGSGTITGVPYIHSTHLVAMDAEDRSGEQKVASVEDCTLVSVINSNNLVKRLHAFYCDRPEGTIKIINTAIRFAEERCGRPYLLSNPFGEREYAYLSEMDLLASSFHRAECKLYADYIPAGQMGLYHNSAVLTGSGTWTPPPGVTQFYAILIGGGQGGQSGEPGQNGGDANTYVNIAAGKDVSRIWYGAEGGDGGAGGKGGKPGRVLAITVSADALQPSYAYNCGKGGAGGKATGFRPDTVDELRAALDAKEPGVEYSDLQLASLVAAQQERSGNSLPQDGQPGTATTFGAWSTDGAGSYQAQGAGVYDPISTRYYAQAGQPGSRGGKGGARLVSPSDGEEYWTTDGEDITFAGRAYRGGRSGGPLTVCDGLPEASFTAYGGNGAGAAVGLGAAEVPALAGQSDTSASWDVTTD